jgi:hypothetical protein
VADEVNLALGFKQSFLNNVVEPLLDEYVGTFGVESDAGEVSAIANAPQPGMKLLEISVGTQETRDNDDGPNRLREECLSRNGRARHAAEEFQQQIVLLSKL